MDARKYGSGEPNPNEGRKPGAQRTEGMLIIRRRVGQKISRMTKEEALAYLLAHRIYVGGRPNGAITIGGRLGDPGLKALTGGYSSQTLDGLVLRKLAVKAGIIKNPN